MSQHTPGPWRLEMVEDRTIKHLCPVGADDLSLLTVVHSEGTPFAAVYTDADARLIAAAPTLLAALQTLMKVHDEPAGFAGKYGRKLDELVEAQRIKVDHATALARAAIIQATGEQA